MRVVARYSHKGAQELFQSVYRQQLAEVISAIEGTRAEEALSKRSKEITMVGKVLYSPVALNVAIKSKLYPLGWATPDPKKRGHFSEPRVNLSTTVAETGQTHRGYRAMDGIKERVGLEIQFGKYAFMGYDILAKMVIFHKRDKIDAGIEIVPMKSLSTGSARAKLELGEDDGADEDDASEKGTDPADAPSVTAMSRMSTGVSYFEQIKADLEARQAADLDIPVLILGIDV